MSDNFPQRMLKMCTFASGMFHVEHWKNGSLAVFERESAFL
ncbi:hypothetical protein RU94_GL002381 [Enterococcus asini]|nr:hypothetical protein RU94_GL002381 [Enterococcus asini]